MGREVTGDIFLKGKSTRTSRPQWASTVGVAVSDSSVTPAFNLLNSSSAAFLFLFHIWADCKNKESPDLLFYLIFISKNKETHEDIRF